MSPTFESLSLCSLWRHRPRLSSLRAFSHSSYRTFFFCHPPASSLESVFFVPLQFFAQGRRTTFMNVLFISLTPSSRPQEPFPWKICRAMSRGGKWEKEGSFINGHHLPFPRLDGTTCGGKENCSRLSPLSYAAMCEFRSIQGFLVELDFFLLLCIFFSPSTLLRDLGLLTFLHSPNFHLAD
jgi:hypothetical protein